MIVIPFASQVLALTESEFAAAVERGKEFATPEQTHINGHEERLLTAEQIEAKTGTSDLVS